MRELSAAARRLTREELGGTLAEYALVLAGVALLAVIGTRALGGSAKRSYEQSVAAITEAIGGASSRAVCRPG
jgi:Flp pilus assembly pilin Flp